MKWLSYLKIILLYPIFLAVITVILKTRSKVTNWMSQRTRKNVYCLWCVQVYKISHILLEAHTFWFQNVSSSRLRKMQRNFPHKLIFHHSILLLVQLLPESHQKSKNCYMENNKEFITTTMDIIFWEFLRILNEAWLLVINMVHTSCLTSYRTT